MNTSLKNSLLFGLMLMSTVAIAEDYPREAYSQPVKGLSAEALDTFYKGRTEFLQTWVIPPEGGNSAGLGPLFNRPACVSCHQKNGRGRSPNSSDERMLSMLVRLSVAGTGEHGSPKPHPYYGNQLDEEGVHNVAGEGRAALHWQEKTVNLADGAVVKLRSPTIEFIDLAYGSLDGVLTSLRVGPPVYGLGLLESVPVSTLQKIAEQQVSKSVHGSFNQVWDGAKQQMVEGRFGLKANSPNVRQQIAEAFIGDLGITTPLFSKQPCTEKQTDCLNAPQAKSSPELPAERLADLDFYTVHLAPPARRNTDDPKVKLGEQLFTDNGCAVCHVPKLETAAHPRYPATLPPQSIEPYTDLLLHDMGEGLADGRPDFSATGSQWRTPPLWGIGLVPVVNGHNQYLHDGRARNLEEAIVWHDGEALAARNRYTQLTEAQRQQLLAFLQSL
jgi:CxxC motif-containing protein (DUF1111 family)